MCAACTTLDHGWKKVIYESRACESESEEKGSDLPGCPRCPKCPSADVLKGCQSLRVASPLMSKCRSALPAVLPMPMPMPLIPPRRMMDVP
jgi:hypothetical protein